MKFPASLAVILVSFLTTSSAVFAADPAPASAGTAVAQLAFLKGTWYGPTSSGRMAEEVVSSPEGGVMVSAGREFKDGRCVFFDLSVFAEKAGKLTLQPYPNGKIAKDDFPATSIDVAARRVVFENPAHDFPKKFVYEVKGDQLKITLSGEMKGKMVEEVFDLKRVP